MNLNKTLITLGAFILLGATLTGCQTTTANLEKKAKQGDAQAQYELGMAYATSNGVPQDYKLAIKWMRSSAEQGNPKAQNALGNVYFKGQTVPQDYQEAAKWYRLAAEQGYASAQFNLGSCYASGSGCVLDVIQAYAWYNLAAAQGDEDATRSRANLMKKMSRAQINAGQKLSKDYSSKYAEQ
ncbi:MAG: sel1 repeat family protein [Kiritimatiellaceae bacterium]|nr:sel1 repeat family protein [Kiritimatiellaceae bacterium]